MQKQSAIKVEGNCERSKFKSIETIYNFPCS